LIGNGSKQYQNLCERLDQKFAEIQSKYPQSFACGRGCHSCCKPGLTVNRLEKAVLERHFQQNPQLQLEAKNLEESDPHKGTRCRYLRASGDCLVYEVRPIVCRSHGAPLELRSTEDENIRMRDVCPLNFKTLDIVTLPNESVLNLETLNTLLGLLTKLAFPGDETRTPI